ncbi:hypothetical protein FNV43_RR09101 [Rhamnella rubrinervis]|uniref:Uncharacterized protein n=1 Tax=Rhamnella rubrinervis TaxID=2594499 RepID=A0A8K0MJX1_9ROSA|nr:hypothetical protein FNV43_RR09101 [Rhamnella rubrinervis]
MWVYEMLGFIAADDGGGPVVVGVRLLVGFLRARIRFGLRIQLSLYKSEQLESVKARADERDIEKIMGCARGQGGISRETVQVEAQCCEVSRPSNALQAPKNGI